MLDNKKDFFSILLKVIRIILQLINVAIILTLLSVHFIIKEHTFWSSLFFYILPLPVIIFGVLCLSILLTKKWRRYNLILALILTLVWLGKSFKVHIPNAIKESDLEVVFWNASRENTFESTCEESEGIPDVMVLTEFIIKDLEELKIKYPQYYFYNTDRELFIFSKTPLVIDSDKRSKNGTSVINFETANINFYAVDVQGSPDVPRGQELTFVNENIKENENTIVLGDFNTPYESMYLKHIKKEFNQAFNIKGNGFRETWFFNLPLLSLDHIWVSKDLKILKTQKIYTLHSDHSMLKTYIKH